MEVKIDLSQESLDQIGLENIKKRLNHLFKLFGLRVKELVPSEINNYSTLISLINMSSLLEGLQDCPGFNEHILGYFNNPTSTQFVSYIAKNLISKVDFLELEPHSTELGRKPDIKIINDELEFYIECKYPFSNTKFDFYNEHKKIEERIRNEVSIPHQIDVSFYSELNDEEITRIINDLKHKLSFCRSSGVLINTKKYKVSITFHEDYQPQYLFEMPMKITLIESHTNNHLPGNVFLKDGRTISIAGPQVDYVSVLTKLIKKSSGQAVVNKPFVLAISINNMLGSLQENILAIQDSFQPKKNTRFTGVVLVEHLGTGELSKRKFIYIENPFSSVPDSNHIKLLFHEE